MKTHQEYLKDLHDNNPEQFKIHAEHTLRDSVGIAHPNAGSPPPPKCQGEGPTPNGYWIGTPPNCQWISIG